MAAQIACMFACDNEMCCQLVFGNCGVLQGISQGKGFVNMSTVDVETSTDVCEVHFKPFTFDIVK